MRINPDTNVLIYKDIDNSYVLPVYKQNAKRIRDMNIESYHRTNKKNNTKYSDLSNEEHPNEAIAYYLSNLLVTNSVIHKDIIIWL